MKSQCFIWFPRIMLILFAIFLVVFSLDVFEQAQPLIYQIEEFLIHSIPTITLLAILWLAWKRPMLCGILLLLVSFIFTVTFKTYTDLTVFLLISGAPFFIGLLFIFVHYIRPKNSCEQDLSINNLHIDR